MRSVFVLALLDFCFSGLKKQPINFDLFYIICLDNDHMQKQTDQF